MDTIKSAIDYVLNLGMNWPDLVSLIIGMISGTMAAALIDYFFVPETWPKKKQQGVSLLVAIVASVVASNSMWALLDAKDSQQMRLTVSFIVAIPAVILLIIGSRWATNKWPFIASAWGKDGQP